MTPSLCLAGFLGLALGGRRVRRRIGVTLASRAELGCRVVGVALLVLAAGVAIGHRGGGVGLVAWCGHLSLGAGLVYLGVIRRERSLSPEAAPP
ncbi:DUF3325 family protein [Halomonas koreensis]|uniref:DUF3325 family protein n=1 Tax=Halomonas koreensis TaxID=245385 RepID=A0ABU1G3C6_9GAMM|nr:DUF3325 family protein [Halomonas koreensis]MDR5867395.1 DUF3325 family protein [Halomonas koreensis]